MFHGMAGQWSEVRPDVPGYTGTMKQNVPWYGRTMVRSLAGLYQMDVPGCTGTMTRISLEMLEQWLGIWRYIIR